MSQQNLADSPLISLTNLPASARQCRSIFTLAVLLTIASAAIAPFSNVPLPQYPAFVPAFEAIISVNDFITSIFLFMQYSVFLSTTSLVLACGYLFTALIVIPQALTFPGVFSPTGLLGAGRQSASWLFYFWQVGIALTVLTYAFTRKTGRFGRREEGSSRIIIVGSVASVCALAVGLTWIATVGHHFLPELFFPGSILMNSINARAAATSILVVAGLALLILWNRRSSLLDYWLMLVLWTLILEHILSVILSDTRYSVAFYFGRLFALGISLFVLMQLMGGITKLYTNLARSHFMLERERNNKLMNIEATTAAIAHELSQPLTAMVANADASVAFLEQTPPNLLQVKDALNDIIADAHHTAQALDGIRNLFRSVNQVWEPVDVNEICREMLHSTRSELKASDITVQAELASEVPPIRGNRGQLQQVILNLVHNAIEAMVSTPARSRVLRLITQRLDDDRIIVAVHDTGPGVDPKNQSEIFDAFVTTKSHGTGLGLAICRIIVERHGGELVVFSDGRNGALFQFFLPIDSAKKSP